MKEVSTRLAESSTVEWADIRELGLDRTEACAVQAGQEEGTGDDACRDLC